MAEVYKNPEEQSESMSEETKKKSFDEWMDFLAKDEEDAIKGYDEVIESLDDEGVIEQLKKIREEEENHLRFLREVKENHELKYVDEKPKEE